MSCMRLGQCRLELYLNDCSIFDLFLYGSGRQMQVCQDTSESGEVYGTFTVNESRSARVRRICESFPILKLGPGSAEPRQ